MFDPQHTYIYESPDGGHTVYRRLLGSKTPDRELHSISEEKRKQDQRLAEEKIWNKISQDAKNDAVLKEMLDKIIVYHTLKNSP